MTPPAVPARSSRGEGPPESWKDLFDRHLDRMCHWDPKTHRQLLQLLVVLTALLGTLAAVVLGIVGLAGLSSGLGAVLAVAGVGAGARAGVGYLGRRAERTNDAGSNATEQPADETSE